MGLLGMLFGGVGLGVSTYAGNKPVREKKEYERIYGEVEGYHEWMLRGEDMAGRIMKKKAFGWKLSDGEKEWDASRKWLLCPNCEHRYLVPSNTPCPNCKTILNDN